MQRTQALVRGIIADIVIPYSSTQEADLDRLQHEVKLLDRSNIHGLSVGGVLGGVIGAGADELSALCATVRRDTKKPLFAVVFPDASPEAYEFVRAADASGADAILVAQPHYLAQPEVAGLVEMFGELRALTRKPLLLADCFPESLVGVNSARVLAQKKLVDGIYEAADMHVLVDLLCARLAIPVYSCIEDLHYPALMLGAQGVISNLASVFPLECVDLYSAVQNGDHQKARTIHERLLRVWRVLNHGTERESRLRCALQARGRPVGAARSPYGRLAPTAVEHVTSILRKENAL